MIAQDLYTVEAEVKMPGTTLPARSVLVKTPKGNVLISPVPGLKSHLELIRELGGVQYLVAPNLFHHMNYPAAVEMFPDAERWCAPGLPKKRSDIPWQKVFGKDEWPLEEFLSAHLLDGCRAVNEVVFYHGTSQTLIVTDLCFNLENPKGWAAGIIYRLFGTYKRFACSRLFAKAITDKPAFAVSLTMLLEEDFTRIIMGHGTIVEKEAKQKLTKAFEERGWL